MAAGHHQLGNLVVIVDYNHLQSYGRVDEICDLEPLRIKWESFGFNCVEIDGHDLEQLRHALNNSSNLEKPIAVIAHTIKGRGVAFAEGVPSWHHKSSLSNKDIEMMREAVNNA
jgi:transketolase